MAATVCLAIAQRRSLRAIRLTEAASSAASDFRKRKTPGVSRAFFLLV